MVVRIRTHVSAHAIRSFGRVPSEKNTKKLGILTGLRYTNGLISVSIVWDCRCRRAANVTIETSVLSLRHPVGD
jgi:hypothetical protein